jgi:hypothetical protein
MYLKTAIGVAGIILECPKKRRNLMRLWQPHHKNNSTQYLLFKRLTSAFNQENIRHTPAGLHLYHHSAVFTQE